MVEIREVKTKKEIKEFINFPLKLYKDNPYFVPPLYGDELALFKKDFMYSDQCEHIYFNAYREKKIVGRISGILQKASNEKWNQKRVRFTRFDSIDDKEVAHSLLKAVEDWAISLGMNEVVGPLGFSDLEREGLLIEGFDEVQTFEEQYNYPYYQELIESYGYSKEVDWLERQLKAPKEPDDRLMRLSNLMLRKFKLKHAECKSTKEFLDRYADQFFEILDKTYVNIYQSVPFTEKMKKSLISSFKLIVDVKYVSVIVDENNRVVCFGLAFPAIGEAVKKSGGRLTIPTLFKVLKCLKKPKALDLALIGVLPEYESKGIASNLVAHILNILSMPGIEYAETNLNLEDNTSIINMWKHFDSRQHKRRRSFVKKL